MKRSEVDKTKLSPMMRQYMEIKDEHLDELLFYRIGDFYELFFEDGEIASRELELTLTGKNAGLDERVPMCGVPFHSVKPYIEKLVNKGFKVAICEQLEDPKKTKDMIKRGVIEVISKGTILDPELLNEHDNHYIASIIDYDYIYSICYADISTGDIYSTIIPHNKEKLLNTILNLGILEIVLKENLDPELISLLKGNYNIEVSFVKDELEDKYQNIYEDITDIHMIHTIKTLLYYLVKVEIKNLDNFKNVKIIYQDDYLEMDAHTISNLELVETIRLKERNYSLIWLLDKTKTSMGSRKLKNWLLNPLKNKDLITKRYDNIETLNNEFILKDELRDSLYNIYDIERLCGKVTTGSLNARDLLQLKTSLKELPKIKSILKDLKWDVNINTHDNIYKLIDDAIAEDPPVTIKEGGIIKTGYNKELDELRDIRSGGKDFIASFENKLRDETGIKTLKVGYNKVFGYFIEISKGQTKLVTEDMHFERRQTLTNAERYISPELKEKEALILNAEEKITEIEYNIFLDIKKEISNDILSLLDTANILAEVDATTALSVCAEEYHFVRPELNDQHIIEIKDGRHPVVEIVSNMEYVKNDCIMDNTINTLLITGPNMSGKSTFMRQLAIIVILAQMGSYVPASYANLPIIDKIFTRIGASDDLVSGESTFMVEMNEAKRAICDATKDSLILFDELGRGTATYDGMSLASSILKYVTTKIGCKTLFSTHYHELTSMDAEYPSIKNVHVSAKLVDDNLIFEHKIKNGAIDKSYGIHVAKLAGLPDEVIKDANKTLEIYEKKKEPKEKDHQIQFVMNYEEKDKLKEELDMIDPLRITPIEALNILYKLKEISKEK